MISIFNVFFKRSIMIDGRKGSRDRKFRNWSVRHGKTRVLRLQN